MQSALLRRFTGLRGAFLAAGLALGSPSPSRGQQIEETAFVRGDTNIDGERDIGDVVHMLICTFVGTACSSCAEAADVNDDGLSDVSDPIYLLAHLFLGGPRPPPPGECGLDPTADRIGCRSFPLCASGDSITTSRGELLVVPIDHGSVVLQWNGKTIYADPVGGAQKYRGVSAPDIVVIMHTHRDHMDANTLLAVVTENTVLVVPAAVARALAGSRVSAIAEQRVLANGETTEIGDVEIEAIPMYNLTAARLRYHSKGQGNGYVLDLDGTRVYVAGDTEDIPEMRALQDIDLAFVCMNLPFTMTPRQAAGAVLEFQPRVVYPYHYRGQDPDAFKSFVETVSPDIEVRVRDWYP